MQNTSRKSLHKLIRGDNLQIVHDYRALHAIAELDRELPKTVAYVQRQLKRLKCRIIFPAKGAVCAYFDFGRPKTLAFRADMDALPVQEQTGLPWRSRHPGIMHACGHDGHTAILLELARKLNSHNNLKHNVLLIFQPAEETDGGAKDLCRTGLLSKYHVCAVFGLHLWPGLPKGQLFSKPGLLMSRSCGVKVLFAGRSVHISDAAKGSDALSACCHFLCQAEKLQLNDPHLLKFGKISGGTAANVICDRAELWGSLRSFSEAVHQSLKNSLQQLCAAQAERSGCLCDISFTEGYPAVQNDPGLWEAVQKKCAVKEIHSAFWTADDFSFYQAQVPGIYFLLGIGDSPPLHSPVFSFDETVLSTGADLFFRLCQTL